MGFVDKKSLRFRRPHRLQQRQVGRYPRCAVADRSIAFHLPHHQHHPPVARGPLPSSSGQVVFGDRLLHQLLAQGLGPRQLRFRPGSCGQPLLQIAGSRGVVIHPALVHHPGDRIDQIRPQAHRTQEAVLHLQ